MTTNAFWLAVGAFLTSPGAGLLGVLGAAYLALVGVDRRLSGDRLLAQEAREAQWAKERGADARERWQRFHDHLWVYRAVLPPDAMIAGIESLADLVETQEQSAMLEVFATYLADQAEREGEDP